MTEDYNIPSKTFQCFCCEKCNFTSSRLSQYNAHLTTAKHKRMTNNDIFFPEPSAHECICGKKYIHRQGLYKHKKKCSQLCENTIVENLTKVEPNIENTFVKNTLTPELFMAILKENKELQNVLIEQNRELQNKILEQNTEHHKQLVELASKQMVVNNTNNTTNSNNTNTQNNHFNIQLFLNDKCKDAVNIDQFIKDIQISISDLENVGNQGYVQGISDIIIKNLRTLGLTKRPMHCTDIKRETIYIKDANKWEKDTEGKPKLKNFINRVAKKNLVKIRDWYQEHPEIYVLDSKDYEMNHKLIRQSFGDGDVEVLQNKVVKHLVKETYVDKTSNSIV
jgi:hypothetical protein